MEKVRLGRTGLMVSALGFGGIPIQRLSTEDAVAVVRASLDAGINYLDTAHGYGTSEEELGHVLPHCKRTKGLSGSATLTHKAINHVRPIPKSVAYIIRFCGTAPLLITHKNTTARKPPNRIQIFASHVSGNIWK